MPSRTVWAAAAVIAAFAAGAAATIRFLGAPLRPADYFLGGSIGTLAAMVVLFLVFLRPSDWRNLFYKARRVRATRPPSSKTLDL